MQVLNLGTCLRRYKMAHRKNKDKHLLKLQNEHQYYAKKVDEIEKERNMYRDYDHKGLLMRLKKIKLFIKDQIEQYSKNFKQGEKKL